ncbi:MAG: hypothetical protein GY748_09725 [Planctomycetaceae bacterium]|nr:hypothetical protein [Planctomycetaceae bacterium]
MKRNRVKNSKDKDFLTREDEKRQRAERKKAVQEARNAKKYEKVKEARLKVPLPKRSKKADGSVNDDAKRFLKGYNERTRFEVCGVCGTDEEPRNLKLCNDTVLDAINGSDLPRYRSYLMRKLDREWHSGYLESIEAEFDVYGMLRGTRYICKWCWNCFNPKTKKNAEAASSSHMDVVEEQVVQNANQSSSSNGNQSSSSNGNEVGSSYLDREGSDDHDQQEENVPELGEDSSDEEEDEHDEEGDEEGNNVAAKYAKDQTVWNLPVKTFLRGLYPGMVPEELQVLTLVEISMVSLYNPITESAWARCPFTTARATCIASSTTLPELQNVCLVCQNWTSLRCCGT